VLLVVGHVFSLFSGPVAQPPLLAALAELRFGGAAALAVAALGFVIYNAAFIVNVDGHQWDLKALFRVPGGSKTVYDSALGLTISSAVLIATLIGLSILQIFDLQLPGFLDFLPWVGIALFFVPPLVFASIGINAGREIDDHHYNRDWYRSSNYNTSDDIQSYVDAAQRYHNTSGMVRVCPASPFSHKLGPGADVWDVCGKDAQWFAGLLNASAGDCDDIFGIVFNYSFSVPGQTFPFSHDVSYDANNFSSWWQLYLEGQTSVCYGAAFDRDSLLNAETQRDLCLIRVTSVSDCAPGWDIETFQDIICSQFTHCKADFKDKTQRWEKFGAINVTESGSYQTFQLPAEWNDLDDLADYWSSVARSDLVDILLSWPPVWSVINSALLAVGLTGFLMMGIGIAVWIILNKRGELPAPVQPHQQLSSAALIDSAPYE
jgi:hypothetical protein